MTAIYYGMVAELDDWVGRILQRLDELGLAKNTLVIFTSDHGEQLGEHGLHLQRAHLINNALPGPGAIQPRRPFPTASFPAGTVIPDGIAVSSLTFPVTTVNMLENTARSWYDAGYVNLRRRYSKGLTLLTNYTWSKNLSDAPDFRSPMFEAAIPQNNNNLFGEKGLSCDVTHRFVVSAVYDIPSLQIGRAHV
mgnify:CR=1 FL=1